MVNPCQWQGFYLPRRERALRVLVTGAAGRLGREVMRVFAASHEAFGGDLEGPASQIAGVEPLDILNRASVERAVLDHRADVVIHSAAYTDVDGCERDPDTAFRVNAVGTWNVASVCAKAEIPVLYVSTDFVFDGEKGEPYTEFDAPNPVSVYGRSKLAGEQVVRRLCRKHWIGRTAWLYADEGGSFPAAILNAASAGKPLKVVTDQIGSPTYCPDLAEAIYRVVVEAPQMFGTYHLVNTGHCSRYELAKKTVGLAGLPVETEKTTTEEYIASGYRGARRPKNGALRTYSLELLGMKAPRPWEEALSEFVRKWTTARR